MEIYTVPQAGFGNFNVVNPYFSDWASIQSKRQYGLYVLTKSHIPLCIEKKKHKNI